jgi:glycosyltransferase involved in cell wall biosynthesis
MMEVNKAVNVVMIGPFPDDATLIKGGVQASVYGLAKALKGKASIRSVTGISTPIKAIAGNEVYIGNLDGIEVMHLNTPFKLLISSAMHIPAILRKINSLERPLAHIHGTGMLQTLLCIALRFKRIPFVWTLHGITEKETRQQMRDSFSLGNLLRYVLYTFLERLSLWVSPHIIVDTNYVRDEIFRKDAEVIPQGIFIDELAAIAEQPRTEKIVLSVGVISPRKGHLQTIEAFAQVLEKVPDARLVIAGSLTDPSYLEEMKSLIRKLEIENEITLEIQQPRNTILGWLAKAQVFALHSQEESQGIAICEALASGLPVVATHVGGIPYVVTDIKNAILVKFGDIDAFAKGITTLLTNETIRNRMATHARMSGKEFSWDSISDKVIQLYQKAAKLKR